MSIEDVRLHLGGESLYLYYIVRDLDQFKRLWITKYNQGCNAIKLEMLRELSTKYKQWSRDIIELL